MPVKSLKGLKKKYSKAPQRVRDYFAHFEELVDQFPYDVALSYVFGQLEMAQNMALYCGIVKLHKAESALTWKAIDAYDLRRKDFRDKIQIIYGKAVPAATVAKLKSAEGVRDKVMHGKACSEADKRNALAAVLEYATEMNAFLDKTGGVQPFGDLRGFKGRAKGHDKSTTRWILRGMGFAS